jgi:hypothetical protein
MPPSSMRLMTWLTYWLRYRTAGWGWGCILYCTEQDPNLNLCGRADPDDLNLNCRAAEPLYDNDNEDWTCADVWKPDDLGLNLNCCSVNCRLRLWTCEREDVRLWYALDSNLNLLNYCTAELLYVCWIFEQSSCFQLWGGVQVGVVAEIRERFSQTFITATGTNKTQNTSTRKQTRLVT